MDTPSLALPIPSSGSRFTTELSQAIIEDSPAIGFEFWVSVVDCLKHLEGSSLSPLILLSADYLPLWISIFSSESFNIKPDWSVSSILLNEFYPFSRFPILHPFTSKSLILSFAIHIRLND
jgi:hypothetical protein